MRQMGIVVLVCMMGIFSALVARGEVIWIEGEKPAFASVTRHPWWYDKVKRDDLSGRDLISNWDANKVGVVEYHFTARRAGAYDFWLHANPVQSSMSYSLNGQPEQSVDMSSPQQSVNIAENGALDVRFIAWMHIGRVQLKGGSNAITFRFTSGNNHHGYLDCFVFDSSDFEPHGVLKPGEEQTASPGDAGWFRFDPAADDFTPTPIDLRILNERLAGDGGFIAVKGGEFVHSKTGEPVRFWGVNGPPFDLTDPAQLARCARLLAKHGVNLVRVHHGYFDDAGNVDMKAVRHAIEIVQAMKQVGIYTHFSTYYYQWLHPKAGANWLEGYDGKQPPPAMIFFNPMLQQHYRAWLAALLTTPAGPGGARLIDEPAVASLEVLNEDSLFFWTFDAKTIPRAQMQIVEARFAAWLEKKYGSLTAASSAWGGQRVDGDDPADGRMAMRGLWQIAHEKTLRDQDTADFLVDAERTFYSQIVKYVHELGFRGVVTASNWITADPQVLGPLERYAYTAGDFVDRHWYLDCSLDGDNAAWSIRDGYSYMDRSALRCDPPAQGQAKVLSSGAMDVKYDGKPSMISEVDFNRPSRYRSEGPLYLAAYGSLQGSNAIEHFALDGAGWSVKPGFFMQPWTLMSPGMMGQFPAAALIYRRGLIAQGEQLVTLNLKIGDLMHLRGAPRGLEGDIDEKMPVSDSGGPVDAAGTIDPLACFAGRASVRFTSEGGLSECKPLGSFIDRTHRYVTSTNGQLQLDYENGILTLDAPQVQGVSGNLAKAGAVRLRDLAIISSLELGHIVAVSLDNLPLTQSGRILLQVASEEKNSEFVANPTGNGRLAIASIGHDPWLMKDLAGEVRLMRPDAANLKVTALNFNGYPKKPLGGAAAVQLLPDTMYYLIER
jgi:hypothetical protein